MPETDVERKPFCRPAPIERFWTARITGELSIVVFGRFTKARAKRTIETRTFRENIKKLLGIEIIMDIHLEPARPDHIEQWRQHHGDHQEKAFLYVRIPWKMT